MPWWQVAVATAALVAAAVAVWVTLEADFLAHPGWLAVQKADFILGPVLVGLYWMRVRPQSRYGPMLIVFGFIGAVYIVHSSSNPWLFGFGLLWEVPIVIGTQVLILTFPTGRLDGLFAKLLLLGFVALALLYVVVLAMLPQFPPGGSISGCRELCPENGVAITSNVPLAIDLNDIVLIGTITVALATVGLLLWRIGSGTPPQRRALAIGTPIALLFLLLQAAYNLRSLLGYDSTSLDTFLQWAFAGARSMLWYGFLFALIAAQLFAGRALHRLVRQSLRRPSLPELETMLRAPLGDPDLRLTFLDRTSETAADQLLEPGPGREVTIVQHEDGAPGAAIDHDAQLADDPELLRAAGVVALLAAENAELDTAWHNALRDLRQSRARIVIAGDVERRKIERNLHDGVQQRLVAIRIQLGLVGESAEGSGPIGDRLQTIGDSVEQVMDELREVAHGLYPPVLSNRGVVAALEHALVHLVTPVAIHTTGITRYPAEVESAVYYSCLEAIQNATKHGGPDVAITVTLLDDADELRFEVVDDGTGFDPAHVHDGTGVQNIRDRVGAIDGRVSIGTAVGDGTVVTGSIPLHGDNDGSRPRLPTPASTRTESIPRPSRR